MISGMPCIPWTRFASVVTLMRMKVLKTNRMGGRHLNGALESWPEALKQYRNDELVMSAIGGLVSYLRSVSDQGEGSQ